LAVLSALLAPVSMLAQDVRTGKLDGVCSLTEFLTSSSASTSIAGDAAGLSAADSFDVTRGDAAPAALFQSAISMTWPPRRAASHRYSGYALYLTGWARLRAAVQSVILTLLDTIMNPCCTLKKT